MQKILYYIIAKPSKEEYRFISLASCIMKILKKIIKRRLERYIEREYLLPDIQFGFRRGKSCDDCLTLINLEIYKIFISGD